MNLRQAAQEMLGRHPSLNMRLLQLLRNPRVSKARRMARRVLRRGRSSRIPVPGLANAVAKRRKSLKASGADWLGFTLGWILYHEKSKWMGIAASRNPLDAWVYQQIIWETRPEVVVELGAFHGGTSLFLANMMDLVSMRDSSYRGEVIAVDIDKGVFEPAWHPRISFVCGSTEDEAVYSEVGRMCLGKNTMLIHDASHIKDEVLRDLEMWSPLVSPGQYLVIEDGIVDLMDGVWGHFEGGPLTASAEFLASHPDFELDLSREAFVLTYNQMGFLKKVDGGRGIGEKEPRAR